MNSKWMISIVLNIFIGGIALTTYLGYFETSGSKTPSAITEGDFIGLPNPEDIQGSYTFMDVAMAFDIPLDVILEAFGVPGEFSGVKVGELEEIYGAFQFDGIEVEMGTAAIRLFTALYTGLPYDDEVAVLPLSAVEILDREGVWTEEAAALYGPYVIDLTTMTSIDLVAALEASAIEHETEVALSDSGDETHGLGSVGNLSGNTTFSDVMTWGISEDKLIEILGEKPDNWNIKVKDYCEQIDTSYGKIKEAIQSALAQ